MEKFSVTHAFLLVTLLVTAFPVAAQETNERIIHVALPDTLVTESQIARIPVSISDVSMFSIFSFQFEIAFDSTVIMIDRVIPDQGIAEGFLFLNNFEKAGTVIIAAAGADSLQGAGVLFYLEATFLKDGMSNIVFDRAGFEPDSANVVLQNGRLRNITLASTEDEPLFQSNSIRTENFPNPFRSTTRISMDLPEPAQVSVEIFNVTGQLKKTYPPRIFQAGENRLVIFDASALPAGLYYYRITALSSGTMRTGSGAMTIIH